MLVLTRNIGEGIVIDGNIRVHVLGFQGRRVRIGISAPDSVAVDRAEVAERRCEFPDLVSSTAVWPDPVAQEV